MNKPLILVVEDDAPVRSLITTTLRALITIIGRFDQVRTR